MIRPLRPDDAAAVGQIAFETGFFGHSAAPYFPDEALFAALWVGPYFRGGAGGFVAEVDGVVRGYVLGSPDPGVYRLALQAELLEGVLPRWPRYRRALGAVPYLLRALLFPTPHADWRTYPAHLHINLLPQARGLHLGEGLLRSHLAALRSLGVPGVQLSTTTENQAALGLYRKLGFVRLAEQVTPLWTPWLGHPARHVIMGRRLSGPGQETATPGQKEGAAPPD
ncbi:N-acetyltransferase [Deinococcus cavernae]|uniref:N-acetyltransferase n=1 Tax=Deinococcus cavernae TaxID=2320857 RepID=A0A418UZQ3_9DEIO|nr:GNAT family N-acetyltransferase [Deinococcus cavernae]RJF68956.1 N-acetyltransferase [Deinococcus cavernae]